MGPEPESPCKPTTWHPKMRGCLGETASGLLPSKPAPRGMVGQAVAGHGGSAFQAQGKAPAVIWLERAPPWGEKERGDFFKPLVHINKFLVEVHLRNKQCWEIQWGRSRWIESMKDL